MFGIEINVEPFEAGFGQLRANFGDHPLSDTGSLVSGVDHHVLKPRMGMAVGENV